MGWEFKRQWVVDATKQPYAAASKFANGVRLIPTVLALGAVVLAWINEWPWLLALTFLPFAVWYFVSAVQAQRLLDRFTTNELDLRYLVVAPSPMPPEEAGRYFDPPTGCSTVMFLLINESPRQVTLRTQLVLRSVRGVTAEYPQASAYLRWPDPEMSTERTIKPQRDGRVDVAYVAADARKIRFLGPNGTTYMTLDIAPDADEVIGHIDIEAMDRDADVRRVRFRILVNRTDPVALSVEQVA